MSFRELNATTNIHLKFLLVKVLILSIQLAVIFIRMLSLPNLYIYLLLSLIIAIFSVIFIKFKKEIIYYRSLQPLS